MHFKTTFCYLQLKDNDYFISVSEQQPYDADIFKTIIAIFQKTQIAAYEIFQLFSQKNN